MRPWKVRESSGACLYVETEYLMTLYKLIASTRSSQRTPGVSKPLMSPMPLSIGLCQLKRGSISLTSSCGDLPLLRNCRNPFNLDFGAIGLYPPQDSKEETSHQHVRL